jgi:hypothetical protein
MQRICKTCYWWNEGHYQNPRDKFLSCFNLGQKLWQSNREPTDTCKLHVYPEDFVPDAGLCKLLEMVEATINK